MGADEETIYTAVNLHTKTNLILALSGGTFFHKTLKCGISTLPFKYYAKLLQTISTFFFFFF